MDLIEELIGLCAAFEAHGVDYAICGGIALAAAATCRFILEGGKLTFGAGTPEERSVFRVSRARDSVLITLDLLLAGAIYESVWATRRRVEFQGRVVWVVSRRGLIAMKRAAGRGQDLLDIEKLRGDEPGDERA